VTPRESLQLNKQNTNDPLKAGDTLHRYFYELDLEPEAFRDLWNDVINRSREEHRALLNGPSRIPSPFT